uniref:RNA1 polyprotein n=1 Tax=Silene diclinis nepovirus TaxID=3115777 RepID=A0AAT9J7W2_9SECO
MSFHCPNSACINHLNRFSHRDIREDRNAGRCTAAMCGCFLVKAPVASKNATTLPKAVKMVAPLPKETISFSLPEGCLYAGPSVEPRYLKVASAADEVAAKLDARRRLLAQERASAKMEEQFLQAMDASADAYRAKVERAEKKAAYIAAKEARKRAFEKREAKRASRRAAEAVSAHRAAIAKVAQKQILRRKQEKREQAAKAVRAADLAARRAAGLTKKSALRRSLKKKSTKRTSSTLPKSNEPTLGSIFPFSNSLYRESGAAAPVLHSFSSTPQREDFEFAPIPICGNLGFVASDRVVRSFIGAATAYGGIVHMLDIPAFNRLVAFASQAHTLCRHQLVHCTNFMNQATHLFMTYPNEHIFGDFVDFQDYPREALDVCIDNVQKLQLFVESLRRENPIAHSFLERCKAFGNHVKESAITAGCFIGGAVVIGGTILIEKAEDFFKSVMNSCKEALFSVVSPWMAKLHSFKVEIENFWEKCSSWAKNLWSNATLAVQALGVYSIWALMLTILCGIVFVLEKMFQVTSGSIVGLFLSVVMCAAGFTIFNMGRESAQTIRVIRESIMSVIVDKDLAVQGATVASENDSQTATAHSFVDIAMVPINFLDTIASGLSLFSTNSISVLGKLGNSLEGIRKGWNCLSDFLSLFISSCGGAWESMSGKKSSFFRDLAASVKVDIPQWTADARRLVEYAEITGNLDKYEFEQVRRLIYQGEMILDSTTSRGRSYSGTQFLRTAGKLLDELKQQRARCARSLRFDGWRRTPFWLYIYGSSQCGKSTLSNYLAPTLLAHIGADTHDSYSKDPCDKYWTGYYQQKCVKINDLSAVTSKANTPLEQELIPLISTEEKTVSAAEIEAKGVQFLSELILSTSNVGEAPTGCDILDMDAYRNRRTVVLRCRRAAEWVHNSDGTRTERLDANGEYVKRAFDPSDALSCIEVQWVTKNAACEPLPGPAGMWHAAPHTIPLIKNAIDDHFGKEDTLKGSWSSTTGMRNRSVLEVSSYLKCLVGGLGSFKTIQESSQVSKAGENKFLVAVDGKVYSLDTVGHATPEAEGAYDKLEWLESETLRTYRLTYADAVQNHLDFDSHGTVHTAMVRDFLVDMLVDDACVLSVDKLGKQTKQIHKDLWQDLGLSERIFLRVSQKALNQLRAQPHFKVDMKKSFLDHLSKLKESVVGHKEQILFFLCALLLVGVGCYSFYSLFRTFIAGSFGAGTALAMQNQLSAHSVYSSGSAATVFSSARRPIVWARAAQFANAHSELEVGPGFNYWDDGLAHLCVRLVGTSGQSETAILGGPRFIHLCEHQVKMFPDHDTVIVNYFSKDKQPRNFAITWHWTNALTFEDSEVCTYIDDQLTPLPVYSDNLYIRDTERLPQTVNINGVVIKKRKFFDETRLSSAERLLDGEEILSQAFSNRASLSKHVQTITSFGNGVSYTKDLNRYYTSTYASGVHDSGGIITVQMNGSRKVLGLHVAGTKKGSFYTSTIGLLPKANYVDAHSAVDFFEPAVGVRTNGYEKIGYIRDPSKRPHSSTKSQISKVPEQLQLPLPEGVTIKVPAILSKHDERIASIEGYENYDPLKDGMSKFANPMGLLDEDILKSVCEDMYTDWYDCLETFTTEEGKVEKKFLTKTTLDVALNGCADDEYMDAMRLDTSEGYPYVVQRQPGEAGKRRFVAEDENGHRTLIPGTLLHENYTELSQKIHLRVPTLNCVETPKDECLKPSKVYEKPGTRLFDILPFEHNIILREYFLNFCTFLQRNRVNLPCCVGINAYSREWTYLFDSLARVSSTALNCDYSKFDGLISHQIYMWMAATINRIFCDGVEANSARINLLAMFSGRRSIAYDQVYMVRGGLPSGCALTVIANSVFNEILIRYVYRKVTPMPTRNYFNKYVKLLVYGDDNLIAIDEEITPFFDGPVIQDELRQVGVTITDGSDKSAPTLERKPLEKLDFLKRGFRKLQNGLYAAPLERSSLYTRLFYTTAGTNGLFQLDILHDNVKSFLEEIVLHENHVEEFHRVRDFFIKEIPAWRNTLPSYAAAVAFGENQRTKCEFLQPQRFEETRPDQNAYKMMAGQEPPKHRVPVTERLVLNGRSNRLSEEEKRRSFVVAIDCNLFPGEVGVAVKSEVAPGIGCLPTKAWCDKFRSPKFFGNLHEAYKNGDTIYFRSDMPFYAGWCALISFGSSRGMNTTSLLALYRELAPKNAGDISVLLASKTFRQVKEDPRRGMPKLAPGVEKRILAFL